MELMHSIPMQQRGVPIAWTSIINNYIKYVGNHTNYVYLHEALYAEYGAEVNDMTMIVTFPSEEIKAEFLLKWS